MHGTSPRLSALLGALQLASLGRNPSRRAVKSSRQKLSLDPLIAVSDQYSLSALSTKQIY